MSPHHIVEVTTDPMPLKDAAEDIAKIAAKLGTGSVTIGGREIVPGEPCSLNINYHQTPHGDMALHIHLEWGSNRQGTVRTKRTPIGD